MKFTTILALEFAKNLPLILGFVVAARLWQGNTWAALVTLVFGLGSGVAVTRGVEPLLHKIPYEMRLQNVLLNFSLFMAVSVSFAYYFNTENRWLNWKTDLIAGIFTGLLVTFGQGLVWSGEISRLVVHGIAMIVSFPLILLCLRFIIQHQKWHIAMLLTVCVTLFASLLIAAIDYQEMYR